MLVKNALVLGFAALIGAAAYAADKPVKSCCAKPAAKEQAAQGSEKLRCTLTDKVVDKCCCVEREGKTHCTLADKDVASCCCKPVKAETKTQPKK